MKESGEDDSTPHLLASYQPLVRDNKEGVLLQSWLDGIHNEIVGGRVPKVGQAGPSTCLRGMTFPASHSPRIFTYRLFAFDRFL